MAVVSDPMSGTQTAPAKGPHEEAPEEASDHALAREVQRAVHALQAALDQAALAGLEVVPSVKRGPGRFRELGSDAESHVVRIEIYRKLA